MRHNTLLATPILAAGLLLSSCATTPDPAEVCTADWIKPRAERAIKEIQKETGRTIRSLKRDAAKMEKGTLSTLRAVSMLNSMKKLINRLQNGRGVKDLRLLADTCNEPAIVRDGIANYMEDMGAPESLLELIRDIDFSQPPVDTQTPAG